MTIADAIGKVETQLNAGRITGKEYATIMLGMIQTQMQIDADAGVKQAEIDIKKVEESVQRAQIELVDQQILAERIKNGDVHFAYTYDEAGNILSKTLLSGTGKSIYEIQSEASEAERDAKLAQRDVFVRQKQGFDDNMKIKKAEVLSNALGMYAAGGLTNADLSTATLQAADDLYKAPVVP